MRNPEPQEPAPLHPSRRAFVKAGACLAAGLCAGCGSFVRTREPDLILEGGSELRFDRGILESRGSLVVEVADRPDKILVLISEGTVGAVSATCTHMGCDVDYVPERDRIVCPCHGSEYTPWGSRLSGPARRPLRFYRTGVEGDQIVVRLGDHDS